MTDANERRRTVWVSSACAAAILLWIGVASVRFSLPVPPPTAWAADDDPSGELFDHAGGSWSSLKCGFALDDAKSLPRFKAVGMTRAIAGIPEWLGLRPPVTHFAETSGLCEWSGKRRWREYITCEESRRRTDEDLARCRDDLARLRDEIEASEAKLRAVQSSRQQLRDESDETTPAQSRPSFRK